jgi:hypothetical protein
MADEDWWSRHGRRRKWPFFRGWFSEDFDEIFKEMEEMMKKEFRDMTKIVPDGLVRERTLPDGKKVKQWGPFVYGYLELKLGSNGNLWWIFWKLMGWSRSSLNCLESTNRRLNYMEQRAL